LGVGQPSDPHQVRKTRRTMRHHCGDDAACLRCLSTPGAGGLYQSWPGNREKYWIAAYFDGSHVAAECRRTSERRTCDAADREERRAVETDTGNIPPSSACTSASRITIRNAITHPREGRGARRTSGRRAKRIATRQPMMEPLEAQIQAGSRPPASDLRSRDLDFAQRQVSWTPIDDELYACTNRGTSGDRPSHPATLGDDPASPEGSPSSRNHTSKVLRRATHLRGVVSPRPCRDGRFLDNWLSRARGHLPRPASGRVVLCAFARAEL